MSLVAGALDRRRRRRAPRLLGYEAARLRAALGRDGCPICHEVADHDRSYFFWYFNESYFEPHALDALARSLGFCRVHGADVTATAAGAYQLAAVHAVLIRRLRPRLIEDRAGTHSGKAAPLRASAPCPPCGSRDDTAARAGCCLARFLEDPAEVERYARPGLLCFPHLQAAIPAVSDVVLDRLLAVHREAMTNALKTLGDVEPTTPALHLAVGHRRATELPRGDPPNAAPPPRDPVADLLDALGRGAGCAVCLEQARAWREWAGWLEAVGGRGGDVNDLLPACPPHVWGIVDGGSPEIGVTVVRHALSQAASSVGLALETLRTVSLPPWRRPLARMLEAALGPRQRLQRARTQLERPLWCGACRRLDVAEGRVFALVFALMEDARHRGTITRGSGLCLRHLARALALRPPPATRRALLAVAAARLATLEWELDEMLRKGGWEARSEGKGLEGRAWRRAVTRFSGSWTETN